MAYFAPYIDGNGLHIPTYQDRLDNLVESYKSIFGIDAEMNDSMPDYQLLSVFAKSLDDLSAFCVGVFNSRNPFFASGVQLDLLLPQYGIQRQEDETDAELRARIKASLGARSVNTIDGLRDYLMTLARVQLVKVYVNDTDSEDARGISPHSIAVIIYGGRTAEIPPAIFYKKPPGISTWGTTTTIVVDEDGNSHQIKWSRPTNISVNIIVNITKISDFMNSELTNVAGPLIADYANTLPIGESLIIAQLFGLCYNSVPELASKYAITAINVYVDGVAQTNIVNADWNERIACSAQTGVGFVFH